MFNSVNNPFGQKIESAISTGQEKRQQRQDQQQEKEKRYLENDDKDEVKIGGLPILTEEEILALTKNYINNLKSENESNEKVIEKLDKFLTKFDVKKFMKRHNICQNKIPIQDIWRALDKAIAGILFR